MLRRTMLGSAILFSFPTFSFGAGFTANIATGAEITNEVIDGKQTVSGKISNSMIISGGHQYINAGGSASAVILNGGKSTVNGGNITDFQVLNGIQTLNTGARATDTIISAKGIQNVNEGAVSDGATVMTGGRQTISSGGTATNTAVETGGSQNVNAGGSANNSTVNGGALFVKGGSTTNTIINSGKQVVSAGGTTTGDTVNDSGYQNIGIDGKAFNVTVNKGGRQDINAGGYAQNTIINGGRYDIDPTALGENVTFTGGEGYVFEKGILSGTVTLSDHASLYLAESNDATMTLDTGSKIFVINDIRTSNVTLADSAIHFHSQIDSEMSSAVKTFKTLSADRLVANNSNFFMSVEGMQGDFLNITDFSGRNNTVYIEGSGKESSDGYHIIHAGNSNDDAFSLTDGKVELGSFVYTLEKNQDDWYLKQHGDQLSHSAQTVLAMASYASAIVKNEYHRITDRLSHSITDTEGNQVWGRYIHNDTRLNNDAGGIYKIKQSGLELGLGKTLKMKSADMNAGVSASVTDNNIRDKNGSKANVDSYSVGVYSSYIFDNGFYIDGLIKFNHFDNQQTVRNNEHQIATSGYKQNGISSAFEAGKVSYFDDMFVTPYLRMEYFTAKNKNVSLSNGMTASLGNDKSLSGELGVKAGKTFSTRQNTLITPYFKIALENEFIDDNTVTINRDVTIKNDFSGVTGHYGAGVDIMLSKTSSVYSEATYAKGSNVEEPFNIVAGIRVFF
ncbi:TPA: autotransporter outer membrane beta-barrel domain-containing protein [Citrobacter werkmanii]|nr:autotransporter outer membrane beta-barrel domain-containing protein [Citrobacter werkmanii]